VSIETCPRCCATVSALATARLAGNVYRSNVQPESTLRSPSRTPLVAFRLMLLASTSNPQISCGASCLRAPSAASGRSTARLLRSTAFYGRGDGLGQQCSCPSLRYIQDSGCGEGSRIRTAHAVAGESPSA
jgi:hypothetical protein